MSEYCLSAGLATEDDGNPILRAVAREVRSVAWRSRSHVHRRSAYLPKGSPGTYLKERARKLCKKHLKNKATIVLNQTRKQ